MQVAFPTLEDKSLDSVVHSHFGSAPTFILVNTDSGTATSVANPDVDHEHGNCQPAKALDGHLPDAVVVGGIGGGALKKLQASRVEVYQAVKGTVKDNLSLLKAGKLEAFNMKQTCGHHHGVGIANQMP